MLYTQLTIDERMIIDYLYNQQHCSISFIAKELNRNKSTISREIKRNTTYYGYNHEFANKLYVRRQHHKYFMHTRRYDEFTELFLKYYDKKYHGVEATHHKILSENHEIKAPSVRQVFNWIRDSRWVIKRKDRLRQYYKKGGKRKVGIFSKFDGKRVLPIWVRPKSVDKREIYGHWEVDLVIGKRSNNYDNLITFTERITRETLIRRIKTKNPMKCNSVIYRLIKDNKLIVKSITCDNGIEFEKIGLLAGWLNINVFYCEPYASYQRGSNEHVNGIIRRFYKKGTDFSTVTDQEILDMQNKINNMPRKMFNWNSSLTIKSLILNAKR